jgi:hypothetical protein
LKSVFRPKRLLEPAPRKGAATKQWHQLELPGLLLPDFAITRVPYRRMRLLTVVTVSSWP